MSERKITAYEEQVISEWQKCFGEIQLSDVSKYIVTESVGFIKDYGLDNAENVSE